MLQTGRKVDLFTIPSQVVRFDDHNPLNRNHLLNHPDDYSTRIIDIENDRVRSSDVEPASPTDIVTHLTAVLIIRDDKEIHSEIPATVKRISIEDETLELTLDADLESQDFIFNAIQKGLPL